MMGKRPPLCVLLEVARCAVSNGSLSLIVILFVEEEPTRLARRAVRQVHPATCLATGVLGELMEERDGVVFVSWHHDVRYGDADHTCTPDSLPKVTAVTMHENYRR